MLGSLGYQTCGKGCKSIAVIVKMVVAVLLSSKLRITASSYIFKDDPEEDVSNG